MVRPDGSTFKVLPRLPYRVVENQPQLGQWLLIVKNRVDAMKLLLERGANPSAVSADGVTALYVAAKSNFLAAAEILRDYLDGRGQP